MDVNAFTCFDRIFLEKKRANAIIIPEKKATITTLWFKNRIQKLDFLEIRCDTNSVVTTHFFKLK